MKFLINSLMPVALLLFTQCDAQQIQHAVTETVQVYGNCGMCEKTIEKAAFKKGEAKAEWDKDTKMATLTFDSSKTNVDAILQRIAAAGYDSDKFTAPDDAYAGLHSCCQYERPMKLTAVTATTSEPAAVAAPVEAPAEAATPVAPPTSGMVKKQATPVATENPLTQVYTAYFSLKDALVATDGKAAATEAGTLLTAIDNVKMESLSAAQHTVWMKYQLKLHKDAAAIKGTSDTDKQRESFVTLSNNMYEVMKAVKPGAPVYLEHCPMYNDGKGANWLSKEKGIKNPYYGKQMMTCGNVKETIE